MDTRDLLLSLGKKKLGDKIDFLGVYCSDELEKIKPPRKPTMLICNTLKTHDPPRKMGHWVSFYKDGKIAIFLDSFGFPPSMYGGSFLNFMRGSERYYLKQGLQSPESLTCGLFSVFFIHYISRHGLRKCLAHVKKHFSPSKKTENDAKIKRYFMKNNHSSCEMWKSKEEKAIGYNECLTMVSS